MEKKILIFLIFSMQCFSQKPKNNLHKILNLRFILILFLMANISFAQIKFVERKYNVYGTEKGYLDADGLQTGLWQRFYSSGNISEELNYKKGKYNGIGKEFYNKGQLKTIKKYKDGELNGELIEYYENGIKKSEGKYKNGNKSGTCTDYFENGAVSKIEKFDSKGRSAFIRDYDKNGRLAVVKNINKKGSGIYEVTKEDGTVTRRIIYKNHHSISEADFYDNGIIEKENLYDYEEDKNTRWMEKEYTKTGKLRSERLLYPAKERYRKVYGDSITELYHYDKNYISGYFESHYLDGKIAEQGNYKENFKDGIWKSFYKDGRLKFIGKFVSKNPQLKDSIHIYYYPDGQIEKAESYKLVESKNVRGLLQNYNVGSWKIYYRNGSIKELTDYGEIVDERNEVPGKHLVYYENGKLKLEEWILNNKSLTGLCKSYFESGILASEINYKFGQKNGKIAEYFEDGKIKFSGEYKWDDTKIGEWVYYYKSSAQKAAQKIIYTDEGKTTEFFYPNGNKMAVIIQHDDDKDYKDIKVFNALGKKISLNEFASVNNNFKVKDFVMLYSENEFVIDVEIEFENSGRSYVFNNSFK